MILIAIGSLTVLVSTILLWRRAVEMRVIRWELYGLRDQLRRIAYDNPELLRSGIFRTLDEQLTAQSARLADLSLWSVLPAVMLADRQKIDRMQRDFETKLNQPKNAAMIPIYERSSILFARHLAWRHLFLSGLAIITIVGIFLCHSTGKWLASRILSGVVRPITSIPVTASGAAAA